MTYRLVLLVLLLPVACGPADSRPKASASVLTALVATYDSAWVAKEMATVDRLLASDYMYFSSTGGRSSRAATLALLADTSYRLTRSRRSELEVTVLGSMARIASRWQGTGRYQGEPVQDDQTCGMIWTWLDFRWQLFSEHCSNRPVADSTMNADTSSLPAR